jgi:glycosyltransferase involved in cell wall biosynthesis
MKAKTLISIIIPFYKVEDYLDQCLNSILQNITEASLSKVELILVDDCSPDDSITVAKRYAIRYPNTVKIIQHETNKGLGGARNTGHKMASGKYIYFIDSDDYLLAHSIETLILEAEKMSPDEILIFGFKAAKLSKTIWEWEPITEELTADQCLYRLSMDSINPAVWNKLFGKNTIKGLEFPERTYYEDVAFTSLAVAKSSNVKLIPETLCVYRLENNSITRQTTQTRHIEDLNKALVLIANTFDDKLIVGNFFFTRWAHHINFWKLNPNLSQLIYRYLLGFMDNYGMSCSKEKFKLFITRILSLTNIYPPTDNPDFIDILNSNLMMVQLSHDKLALDFHKKIEQQNKKIEKQRKQIAKLKMKKFPFSLF